MTGLYIHVPFCKRKCLYCDFYSLPNQEGLLDSYVDAVLLEAGKYGHLAFDTVFFGGGTPSLLGSDNFSRLYSGLLEAFNLSPVESTVEVNPESAGLAFLAALKEIGINRISIGVQSLNDGELKSVGRIHDRKMAIECLSNAKKVGFENISADTIIGLPFQTRDTLKDTLTLLVDAGLNHISAYGLQLEEDTPLGANPPDSIPSDDEQAELFFMASELLRENGFIHYEISNFAKTGHECIHNKIYWSCGDYLGLGPGASSHIHGIRFKNRPDLLKYLNDPAGQAVFEECLDGKSKIRERAMLRLRLLQEGLVLDDDMLFLVPILDELAHLGDLELDDNRYKIQQNRVYVSNPVFAKVLGI